MNPTTLPAAAALALSLGLAGCGALKPSQPHYPAAAAAQEQVRAAEAAAPADADPAATHRRLVEQMQREGMWYASLAHIDLLEQRTGPSPAVLRLRADALRHTGQHAASRAAYERLAQAPQPIDVAAGLHGLGLLAGADGDFARAADWLEQARQRNPTDARLLGDLGYARLRAGRIDAARVPLMQAAQLQPDDTRMQLNLAAWLLASGQAPEAGRVLDAARQNEAAREAVHEVARQAREAAAGVAAPVLPVVAAADGADGAAPAAPLALRGSGWKDARRIHIGVRRIDEPGPAAASATP